MHGHGQPSLCTRNTSKYIYSSHIYVHTTRENNIYQINVQKTNEKIPSKLSKTTFARFTRKPQKTQSVIPHCRSSFVLICNSLTSHEHASHIQQDSLVWKQKIAVIHEHTRCTTTEQYNRSIRPKTYTNDPTKMTNTKIYARHKYLLVHTTSTYVPLYIKLEHRVLLLIESVGS